MSKHVTTFTRVRGDDFILCTFSFRYGPLVLASGNTPEECLTEIPNHLGEDDTLCFCRVGYWTVDNDGDPSDSTPRDIRTIFEITLHDVDAIDQEDDCD